MVRHPVTGAACGAYIGAHDDRREEVGRMKKKIKVRHCGT
jgi:hypothetical protein